MSGACWTASRALCSRRNCSTSRTRASEAVISASAASILAASAADLARACSASPVACAACCSSRSDLARACSASCLAATSSRGSEGAACAKAKPAVRKRKIAAAILIPPLDGEGQGRGGVSGNASIPSSFPMIGVVRKDGGGAPQLFGEHRAGEEVRPGRLAEGQEEVGRGALGLLEAVGAADHEPGLAPAIVAPVLEPAGEFEGAERLALLV